MLYFPSPNRTHWQNYIKFYPSEGVLSLTLTMLYFFISSSHTLTKLYKILSLRRRSIPHTDDAILFHLPITHIDQTTYNSILHKAFYPSHWQCYAFPLPITHNDKTLYNSIPHKAFYPSHWQCHTFPLPITHNDQTIYNSVPHKAFYPSHWQC